MKTMRKAEIFLFITAVALFVLGGAFYRHVPPLMASHWDAAGNVTGYMPRPLGVFLSPVIFLLLAALLFFIPRMDPKRGNIEKFRRYFDRFLIGFACFFYYAYLLLLLWNVGHRFHFIAMLIPAVAGLLYLIGTILPHTEPNWTIGVRTPWTITSEGVWRKTHRAGGPVFKIAAVVALLGTAFPEHAVWFLVLPVVGAAIGLVLYSYVLYAREGQN